MSLELRHLKGDPLPRLLGPEDPSVRYWTLIASLDRPVSDPEMREVTGAIAQQPLAKELFAILHAEGSWGVARKEGARLT